jgi:hypothetical protein
LQHRNRDSELFDAGKFLIFSPQFLVEMLKIPMDFGSWKVRKDFWGCRTGDIYKCMTQAHRLASASTYTEESERRRGREELMLLTVTYLGLSR